MKKTIEDVMELKYSDERQKQILLTCLRKIKPFSKYPIDVEIPIDLIQTYIEKIMAKYQIRIGYIFYSMTKNNGGSMWTIMLREISIGVYLDTIHASSIYEAFCKAAIRLNYAIKNGEIRERERPADIIG